MWASKKDINNLFDRTRMLEEQQAVKEEKENSLLEALKKHDEQEMLKYDAIQIRLQKIEDDNKEDRKYRNYAIGASILFGFLYERGFISL